MKWFKQLTIAALIAVIGFSSVPASTPTATAASKLSGKIVINGSSALLPLTLQASSEFKN